MCKGWCNLFDDFVYFSLKTVNFVNCAYFQIIDYHMPDVDGVIVTQFIRERESTLCVGNAAYIISYTADVTDSARSILFACGSDEIMTKPPQKGFIENLVKRLVVTMASKEE